ncbi:DUF4328 domain-containing protein [Streptomyces sp. NPDC001914]|uniref:DUF4328 domain-containing protein n=1 Tax=Streptomyces sp. NPDC001914 TaxID=3364623 RepID=UPI00369B8768
MTMPPSPQPAEQGVAARRPLPPLPPLPSPHGPASLRSPVVLGRITAAVLGLVIAADLFGVWADYKLYDVANTVVGALADGLAGGGVSLASLVQRADEADSLSLAAARVQTTALLAAGVVFLFWFRRVRLNAEVFFPAGHTWSRAWVIGGWFVPIVNLWRPRQIMTEIWDASRPAGSRSRLGLVNLWWVLWLAGLVAGRFYSALSRNAETAKDIRDTALQAMIGDGLDIAAAVAAIVVVLKLTGMQNRKALEDPAVSGA